MATVFSGHFIQGLAASLGQYHRICSLYGGQILCNGFTPGAEDVLVGFKYRMKRYDHRKTARSSTLKAQSKNKQF
jgi:hypothetical protein